MNARVKKFIEDYIDLIDQGLWDELFTEWYLHTTISPDQDQYDFAALYDTLINAGALNSYLDTFDVRRNILKVELERELNRFITIKDVKKVHFADLTYELQSFLGYSVNDLHSLVYSLFAGRYGIDDDWILISM